MADRIRQVEYYYVEVPDKPGEGARILSSLKEAGVNLLATCGFPTTGGKAQIDLVPENADALRDAARKLNLKLSERKRAYAIEGQDRVGAVAEVYGKLAKDGINVHAAQAVTAGSGRYGMIVWVKPADHERARKSLGA
jgi:hypothetical protein